MPAITPTYGIPYQVISDSPNGATLGENGFLAVDTLLSTQAAAVAALAARVTALEALSPIWSYLSADSTPVNNSVTYADTGLSFTATSGHRYVLMTDVVYSSATGPDINFRWSVPAGATMPWQAWGLALGIATVEGDLKAETRATAATGVGLGGAGTGVKLSARPGALLVMGGTSGTVKLEFSQNAMVASDTVVHANSWLMAVPLP